MKQFLDNYNEAQPWLVRAGFHDPVAAHRSFVAMAEKGIPLDLLKSLRDELGKYLPRSADSNMALNNLERLFANVRSPLSMVTFLLRKPHSLAVLLQLFGASHFFSTLIISNPEYFDFLWEQGHVALDPKFLREDILAEIAVLGEDDEQLLGLIRRYRQRELLRIGYRDIILGEPLERITQSISDLADCLVDVALKVAYGRRSAKFGEPRSEDGRLSRLVFLAMGKLGGRELNYSSDIDLMVVYDFDGNTDGQRKITNNDFFSHVIRDVIRLLSANTARGQAYRVDLRLRPHGSQAPLCMSLKNTLAYYDKYGRTWERQALVKVRPIAGSMPLGEEFLRGIRPFVYRRYLTFMEINEIKAIKRRIETKTREAGADHTDLKTGHGGIRDIEFVIQFLQLVHGGTLRELRDRNTLSAIKKLARHGCINPDEHGVLETSYRFLRKAEHRLQFMFDLQKHRIPEQAAELDKLALRLGYLAGDRVRPGEQFIADLRAITEQNRAILNRLMFDLFPDASGNEAGDPETNLILDPHPEPRTVHAVLGKYRFKDIELAYHNLMLLANEEVPFLSTMRCRHFLSSIAPNLLQAVAEAPDPDMALVNLEKVTNSLGAKGVLWESFSVNPLLLRLYVNLCSSSVYLSEILINNPGMIDELLDSLVEDRRPTLEELKEDLTRLLRGAKEADPILHGFKNTHLLNIGVQDIIGRRDVRKTTLALSDLPEAILGAVAERHFEQLTALYGTPTLNGNPRKPASYVILALGKFGGRELNYHSDLDIILLYDADGITVTDGATERQSTNNHHFFTELAQRVVVTLSRLGPLGRLYQIDLRLRPTGRSGSLVMPLEKFVEYFDKEAALWERQVLTRGRVVLGVPRFARRVLRAVHQAITVEPWEPGLVDQIAEMRQRLADSRPANDIKRGIGGLTDVEFAVQLMQIKYGRKHRRILRPNVWDCLRELRRAKLWDADTVAGWTEGYTFLRVVESRLRIVHNVSRDDLPDNDDDLLKLAYRMGYEGSTAGAELRHDLDQHRQRLRQLFTACLERERTVHPD